jgi:hypothetical protein
METDRSENRDATRAMAGLRGDGRTKAHHQNQTDENEKWDEPKRIYHHDHKQLY